MMNESAKGYKKRSIRAICLDYKAEFIFGFVLIACVVLSYGLAPFIPIDFFNRHLSVIMNGCIASVCLFGAWIVWMHNDGIGVRKLWAGTLLIWAVLPLNRTYLSQLINTEYGCNFYQYVTNYRIEEAKRMMREHPDMKMQDISEQCGFSSPTVFARVFAKETGVLPREWSDNS